MSYPDPHEVTVVCPALNIAGKTIFFTEIHDHWALVTRAVKEGLVKSREQIKDTHKGFLLSDGSFSNRGFAFMVASYNNQLVPKEKRDPSGDELYSSNVSTWGKLKEENPAP